MHVIVLTLLIGIIAGLRALTAPAAVSWAARLGWLPLAGTPLAFLGYAATPYIFTVIALFELVNDQLPKTPSRTVPPQFIARIVTGGLSGAAAWRRGIPGLAGGGLRQGSSGGPGGRRNRYCRQLPHRDSYRMKTFDAIII